MRKEYRVDGCYDFVIDHCRNPDGTYTLFARNWPANPHSDSEKYTHVNPHTGKLCVTVQMRTLDRALAVGQLWARGYAVFIRTGTFPNQGGRVQVN